MNLIDRPRAAALWTEQDRNLYNQLPVYFNKRVVDYVQFHDTWVKLLKPIGWTPNMGNTMRGVNKVPAPIIRSELLPNPITQSSRKDVIELRETKEEVQIYRHLFESDVFDFLPSFADFLEHVEAHSDAIAEKVIVAKDLFYRTALFHCAPYVYICNPTDGLPELRAAPVWVSPTISLAKNQAYLQSIIPLIGGGLSLENLKKLGTIMYTDLRATPYSGSVRPDGTDGKGLAQKYCLVCETEVWDGFTDAGNGAYLLANKALDLDIVTGGFQGSLFNRWTTRHEHNGLRVAVDGTKPVPESVEENAAQHDYGDTVPNPLYVNATVGVAFAVANEPAKALRVGPPPSKFSEGSSMSMNQFNGMDWSGKVHQTRNVLIRSINEANVEVLDTNKRGEKMQLWADGVMGLLPMRRRHIIPIFYLRERTQT